MPTVFTRIIDGTSRHLRMEGRTGRRFMSINPMAPGHVSWSHAPRSIIGSSARRSCRDVFSRWPM